MIRFGVSPGQARAAVRPEIERFGIWPENEQVFEVWMALGSQWNHLAGMGGVAVLGLNYGAIPPTLEMMGIERDAWKGIFDGLRIMEGVALPLLNKT